MINRLQFRHTNIRRKILQCGLAGTVVLVLLLVLDAVTQTVLIASLGASAFIVFAMPHALHSGPRHLIGGYLAGILAGTTMASLYHWLAMPGGWGHATMVVFGAVAISLAMFTMVVTRTEHPPAAALALGLVLNEWTMVTLVVVLTGAVALSLVKRLVLPVLMDIV